MKSQKHYFDSLAKVSVERKRLENPHSYKVDLSSDLIELKYGLINKDKKCTKKKNINFFTYTIFHNNIL